MKKYKLLVSRSYDVHREKIFALIQNGVFFRLTGADDLHFSFREGGTFNFKFTNRGQISGSFTRIIPGEEIVMEWNVEGFDREKEEGTKVIISISGMEKATIVVEQSNIGTVESINAKHKSWNEILADLEQTVNNENHP